MSNRVQVPRQQVPLIDPKTQTITREWFNSLNAISGSVSTYTTDDTVVMMLLLTSALKAVMFNGTAEAVFQ